MVQRRLFEVAWFIQCLNCSKGIAQLTLDEMLWSYKIQSDPWPSDPKIRPGLRNLCCFIVLGVKICCVAFFKLGKYQKKQMRLHHQKLKGIVWWRLQRPVRRSFTEPLVFWVPEALGRRARQKNGNIRNMRSKKHVVTKTVPWLPWTAEHCQNWSGSQHKSVVIFHCWLNLCHMKLIRPVQAQRQLMVSALTQTAKWFVL